ncbi:MAG: phosphoglucosamine mutase [Candidatus Asgardarchaeia archaeon]
MDINRDSLSHIFRAYDIRGVVGKELTPPIVSRIGSVFGSFIGSGKTVAVASDARTSSVFVKLALISGLLATGINVEDLGMLPIPLLNFYVWQINKTNGIMITASHNPPEYNGIRFRRHDGTGFTSENIEIKKLFFESNPEYNDWTHIGWLTKIPSEIVKEKYLNFLNSNIEIERPITVVIDSGNGAASLISPYLFSKLGCRVISINSHPDGTFPGRLSDPTKANLDVLKQAVLSANADFGVAYDGDGDRAIFVDNKGNVLSPEKVGIIFGKYLLKKAKKKQTIIANVSCSMIVEEQLSASGAEVVYSKVGDVFVAELAKEKSAILGIESSAHYFFPYYGFFYDDAIFGSILMAEIVSQTKNSLNELSEKIPSYPLKTINLHCPDNIKFQVIDRFKELLSSEGVQIITLDGVKIIEESGWILARPSNTEPIIRVTIEGHTQQKVKELMEKYLPHLKKLINSIN